MYNSLFNYSFKIAMASLVYSIVLVIMFSQIMTLSAIYMLTWRYEIKALDSLNFLKYVSFYSFYISILIVTIGTSIFTSMYTFSENGRIFSTLRIFGARKKEIIKLVCLQVIIYSVLSLLLSLIELFILYFRYKNYIRTIYSDFNIINSLFAIAPSFSMLIFIFILVSLISAIVFIQKDPYESMRGTL